MSGTPCLCEQGVGQWAHCGKPVNMDKVTEEAVWWPISELVALMG